ncbi:MAG: hypothetical protein JF586_01930 [Burkholderiales bacterium]|nr:hypothetical protein [Burkholderiales bacterium]
MASLGARLPCAIAAIVLAGCAQLLPDQVVDTRPPFESFAAARRAVERIEPMRTRTAELGAMGFDIEGQRNVTVIGYPDLVTRLAPNSSIPFEALDPGIRDCILARDACRAYVLHFGAERRERRGGFFADFFNFERTTAVSGWRLEALIAVRGDTVLFRGFSGEPDNFRIEHQRNPLGPLQSAGDQLVGAAVR